MTTINTFVDTCTINRILDINRPEPNNYPYEEDRNYLSKIIENYVKEGIVQLFVNPSVEMEIKDTKKVQRRDRLLARFKRLDFTPKHLTAFPIIMSDEHPATFFTDKQGEILEEILSEIPELKEKEDHKILADTVFNSKIQVLLTTDKEHLANDKLRNLLKTKGLANKIKISTAKEFYEYLSK